MLKTKTREASVDGLRVRPFDSLSVKARRNVACLASFLSLARSLVPLRCYPSAYHVRKP